ncbi:flagellar protein FlaG [Paenibacillus sonchi]|nr:flagellar protein FlaG [Paenibacillus riograndensis]MCE3203674.1 flagellar protein FlaG [Paenibacillus sonchi]
MDSIISAGPGGGTPVQFPNTSKKDTTLSNSLIQPSAQVNTQPAITVDNQKTHEQTVAELQKAIDAIQGPQRSLEFSVHKETHAVMIKVLNKETGELIREVPPEKILDLAARMMEITGIIVDKKV